MKRLLEVSRTLMALGSGRVGTAVVPRPRSYALSQPGSEDDSHGISWWQVRQPGYSCPQHALRTLPGHTAAVDISPGDEKKACARFPASPAFPKRWVDFKGQPWGGGVGETGVLSEITCADDRKWKHQRAEGVALGWRGGSELVFFPWRGGGACVASEAQVTYLVCCKPHQPPCSWVSPAAWRGMLDGWVSEHILVTRPWTVLNAPGTNNTDRNRSPWCQTSRYQQRVGLGLAFPSHHWFFG